MNLSQFHSTLKKHIIIALYIYKYYYFYQLGNLNIWECDLESSTSSLTKRRRCWIQVNMVGNLGKSKLAGRKAVKNCSNSKCRQSTWKIPISSSVQGSWSGFCSGSQVEDRCQDEIFSRLSEKSLGSENASQTHHFSKFGFYTPVHRTDSTSTAVIATAV